MRKSKQNARQSALREKIEMFCAALGAKVTYFDLAAETENEAEMLAELYAMIAETRKLGADVCQVTCPYCDDIVLIVAV